jgi:hypothetical protein
MKNKWIRACVIAAPIRKLEKDTAKTTAMLNVEPEEGLQVAVPKILWLLKS